MTPGARLAVLLLPTLPTGVALAGGGAGAGAAGTRWPQLAAHSQRLVLQASAPASVPFADVHGRAAYVLECRQEPAAIVHCSLGEAGRPGASLLVRAGLRDRGLFRERDVQGACASYPQFGRQRSFRLRGFELSLALVDLPPATAGAPPAQALQVDLRPDALATAAVAEVPEAGDPDAAGHGCQAPPPVADPFSCRKPVVEVAKPDCTQ